MPSSTAAACASTATLSTPAVSAASCTLMYPEAAPPLPTSPPSASAAAITSRGDSGDGSSRPGGGGSSSNGAGGGGRLGGAVSAGNVGVRARVRGAALVMMSAGRPASRPHTAPAAPALEEEMQGGACTPRSLGGGLGEGRREWGGKKGVVTMKMYAQHKAAPMQGH